jgi:prepilin-type N-terminal cleavage/methylation domain-containing protein
MNPKPTSTRSTHTRSFSLVELVVVVAILSTLASLLGPSLNQVVDDSRTLSCQKHLKAIGVNLFLYADDHTFFHLAIKT